MSITEKIRDWSKYLGESASHSSFRSSDQFWSYHGKELLQKSDLKDLFFNRDGTRKQGSDDLEQKLKDLVLHEYEQKGEAYFKRGAGVMRYVSGGLYALGGAAVLGGLAAGLAGIPLGAAMAATIAGFTGVASGAGAGTLADIQETRKQDAAVKGQYVDEKSTGGVLGYMKRTANGAWTLVKDTLNPMTYVRHAKEIGEGLVYRAGLLGGYGYAGPFSFPAALADLYRGGKKFEGKVRDAILTDAVEKFKKMQQRKNLDETIATENERIITFPENRRSRILPIDYHRENEPVYALMKGGQYAGKQPNTLQYIPGRKIEPGTIHTMAA